MFCSSSRLQRSMEDEWISGLKQQQHVCSSSRGVWRMSGSLASSSSISCLSDLDTVFQWLRSGVRLQQF